MNIDKYLRNLQNDFQQFIGSSKPVGDEMLQDWQTMLSIVLMELEGLRGAIQSAADVHDGMALMAKLLDSAHTDQVGADEVRCLIEPLRERLWITLEGARQAI